MSKICTHRETLQAEWKVERCPRRSDVNTRVKIHQYARVKVNQCKADGWVDSGFWQGEREGDYPFVSMSQSLARYCRLTVYKSVPAVRIHLAPPPGLEVSGVSADDDRSGGAELRRSEAVLAAVRQKPGCKCNKSDDRQKNGRICEGVERLRQLLHWPDLPFVFESIYASRSPLQRS